MNSIELLRLETRHETTTAFGLLSARVTAHKAMNYYTHNMQNLWPLHKVSITPNIVLMCK
jgi:hypothetical protein